MRIAKNEVISIRENIGDNKRIFFSTDYSGGYYWMGEKNQKYGRDYYECMNSYTNCESELNSFQDAICDAITRLENEKCDQNNIIG